VDAALILEIIAGKDENDSTSADMEVPEYIKLLSNKDYKPVIGLPTEYFAAGIDKEVEAAVKSAVEKLKADGFTVKEISLPHTDYSIAAYYILTTAEASSNLARYDGARYGYRSSESSTLKDMYANSRTEGFGAEVKRRIMLGTYVLSAGYYDAYYKKAQKVRRLLKSDFDKAFSEVDVILTPTSPTVAFKLGEKADDPLQMYLSDIYTVSANLAGIPGMNIPVAKNSEGLPIGLQLMASQFNEAKLLQTSYFIQENHL
jgi:aspartyl-tRNA(Asn)/glutamyl-tRNA(Gln) amidotransferase subunit A